MQSILNSLTDALCQARQADVQNIAYIERLMRLCRRAYFNLNKEFLDKPVLSGIHVGGAPYRMHLSD